LDFIGFCIWIQVHDSTHVTLWVSGGSILATGKISFNNDNPRLSALSFTQFGCAQMQYTQINYRLPCRKS